METRIIDSRNDFAQWAIDRSNAILTDQGSELATAARNGNEAQIAVTAQALGQAIAVYQGTWVRQGTSEVVLVCLLPAMTPAPDGADVSMYALIQECAPEDVRMGMRVQAVWKPDGERQGDHATRLAPRLAEAKSYADAERVPRAILRGRAVRRRRLD